MHFIVRKVHRKELPNPIPELIHYIDSYFRKTMSTLQRGGALPVGRWTFPVGSNHFRSVLCTSGRPMAQWGGPARRHNSPANIDHPRGSRSMSRSWVGPDWAWLDWARLGRQGCSRASKVGHESAPLPSPVRPHQASIDYETAGGVRVPVVVSPAMHPIGTKQRRYSRGQK